MDWSNVLSGKLQVCQHERAILSLRPCRGCQLEHLWTGASHTIACAVSEADATKTNTQANAACAIAHSKTYPFERLQRWIGCRLLAQWCLRWWSLRMRCRMDRCLLHGVEREACGPH